MSRTLYYGLWVLVALILGAGTFWSVSTGGHLIYQTLIKSNQWTYATQSAGDSKVATIADWQIFKPQQLNLISSHKTIVADLGQMVLYLYQDKQFVSSTTILAKGLVGSPWEAPVGEYTVKIKDLRHFSPLAKVWFPYSVQFFGNFFIHGQPENSNRRLLPDSFSAGSIRLANDFAKMVYDFADENTKVLIFGSPKQLERVSDLPDNLKRLNIASSYLSLKDPEKLPLSAESFLVADVETGEIIIQKNSHLVLPIASITKLMTALVSLENLNQDEKTTVTKDAYKTYSKTGRLALNEKIKISDLLYPLLLESSNMSAEVIAQSSDRTKFIDLMNQKTRTLGLKQTYFEDPSGLAENNVSSASDLFALSQYIYRTKKYIFDLTKKGTLRIDSHQWRNLNDLYTLDYYLGGKNGYTDEAGRTLVALFSLPLSEFEQRTIALVLLKSNDRKTDTAKIIRFLVDNVTRETKSAYIPVE
ncbi:MAG: hypothetical protein COX02_00330 [Candidatus Vogelbacteria bacterium CG22_combo_CG10-13_8_21_14_all_37_9]|uniref:L,D-TPase catalytic domain-containing protein n=1 Tax=Candidatus Vogelbacteria bacterium CG22_combo_CG10-13_8_21_14_all_37_9 TaxID=1975046 RepID=A0A2H0BLA8_9BACT|nr:MAG: hypothetical protein BK005_01800 [bacterium CG10_37_50]PIP58411.1 MAG: hypothetical protein COX02_00330 [Candidatus Vogelbacteria bacterium CG22_combo_CG10-13_8_21_14_all_37_9]